MRLLLDTHAFLWFIAGDQRLSAKARSLIEDYDNSILLSIASVWELAIKASLGRLELAEPIGTLVPAQLSANFVELLQISLPHALRVTGLPFHHRDPFDRLLVAQALEDQLPIVSIDQTFDSYGVERIW